MINFGVLQQPQGPSKVQVVQTGGGGGDDIMGGLKGLLGGLGDLKKAFGPNPVSQANNAISNTLGNANPGQVTSSLLPSLMPEQQNPGTDLNRYQYNMMGNPRPIQSQQQIAGDALRNPGQMAPNIPGQGNTSDPSQILNHTMQSIAGIESGGAKNPYSLVSKATGSGDHSYGKYQVTGSNIPSWTKAATGKALTPEQFLANPAAQEATAKHMMGGYLKQFGNPNDVASAWFTGKPVSKAGLSVKDSYGTSNGDYQKKFTDNYNKLTNPTTLEQAHTQPTPANVPGMPVPKEMESTPAFHQTMQAYAQAHQSGVTKSPYVVSIDFSQPATAKRLSVINAQTGQVVMQSEVAQGSGGFNNTPGSHGTETGTFQATQTYNGKHGYSMRVKGLDKENANVEARDIVVHGADYIGGGKTGHSFGCFAVPSNAAPKLINLIKNGSIIHAYRQPDEGQAQGMLAGGP